MKSEFLKFWKKEWTGSEKMLWTTTIVCFGVCIGFLIAPIKKGVTMGCYNDCNNRRVDKKV